MKVWIVRYGFAYEGDDVGGVYSTEEKADLAAKDEKYTCYDSTYVEEYEVE